MIQDMSLAERLAELELALDSEGWLRLGAGGEREFSREGLRTICHLARLFYLKNPLIHRGVNVQADYVFGQGVDFSAADEAVNEAIQQFISDSRNQAELFAHQAMLLKEVELQLFGNLFFAFFTNKTDGRVVVRTIPVDEVEDVLCNPEDSRQPWFYKRAWHNEVLNIETGAVMSEMRSAYYPDWRYRPRNKPTSIGGVPVMWDSPVYHVKVGCLPDMRFGVSQVYAAFDWARAYVRFLEDWATIVRAYSRFAWQLQVKGGSGAVAAAKARLQTTLTEGGAESNPPPVTGSMFIASDGTALSPVRTAGATVSAEDGRRLLLMVAATIGLPESFFGDVSVGTLATARSLDRPTELKMSNRQTLWEDVFQNIFTYVKEQSIRAAGGLLKGTVEEDEDGTPIIQLSNDADDSVYITFPPILEHDVSASVDAIVKAATLGGAGMLAGTIDLKNVSRMLLAALGEKDVDAILQDMFPDKGQREAVPQAVTEALRELRDAIRGFIARYSNA